MENMGHEDIFLKTNRLCVEIASPGTYYKRSRFDWNGFITQVTLDGRHTFCVPESLIDNGQDSGGCGLCGEFGIHEPVGYDEAPVGGCFPKIGVGALVKPDTSAYDFFRDYERHPLTPVITRTENQAEFIMNTEDCNGYSYLYKKKVSVESSCLRIEYYLKNTGSKSIRTTEYCHNFVRIDGMSAGSDYIMKLPYNPHLEIVHEGMETASENEITWKDRGWNKDFYCIITGYSNEKSHVWDLYNKRAGAGLKETNDFPPHRFAVWGKDHVISPEIFKKIDLDPSEDISWSRTYEFYCN